MGTEQVRSEMKKEIRRKLIHILSGGVVLLLYLFGRDVALTVSFVALCVILLVELFRIDYKVKLGVEELLRRKEKRAFLGATYFLISSVICLSMFPEHVAAASLLFITFGDMLAAVVGPFGKTKIFKYKTLEGVLAELIANMIVGYAFVGVVGMVMAIVATFLETFSFRTDDNLLVPVISGATGLVLTSMMRF